MKKIYFLFTLLFSLLLKAQDRPNILWLMTEDMSPYLSCYGNKMIKTPNLDSLAAGGIRFTKAYSSSVQCSPSRSTLISGVNAISLGTDIHREKRPMNDSFYFPIYLRRAGYYCMSTAKQDYNNQKTPDAVWDESSGNPNYAARPDKSKPFFAMYNQGITHMTRVISRIEERKGERSVNKNDVPVPAYIPDLPEVRDDISWNMGAVVITDNWVGKKLDELKRSGEYQNTIIIFSSDHGGTVPRGKGYVYETGTLIPFIVHFPPKWKHLAATSVPSVSNRLISFVDAGPTLLSLAGVPVPSYMQGKPFFTAAANKKENVNKYIFTFRANQGPNYAPSRAITDGRYKLIWNFQIAYPNGTRQDYQWQMPAQQAWDIANRAGDLSDVHKSFWQPVPPFELYDLVKDSMEVTNLVANPQYAQKLTELKGVLKNEIVLKKDAGLIPPHFRHILQKEGDLYAVVRKGTFNLDEVINAAMTASERSAKNSPQLISYLKSKNSAVQYWGASGLCGLAKTGVIKSLPGEAITTFKDNATIEEVKCLLAEAMVYTGNSEDGLAYLVAEAKKGFSTSAACLQNLGNKALPKVAELKSLVADKDVKNKFYLRSVLINCGVIPYSDLYKTEPGETVGD